LGLVTRGPQRLPGQAAAAKNNREQENRLRIIRALSLHIPYHDWPDFIRAYYTSPEQRIKYHQYITPPPFQAPRFDRLCQSTKDWANLADAAWKKHRDQFLRRCEAWVALGVDARIVEKRARGSGKKGSATKGWGRGGNTPLEQRYEWAAKYLAGLPLKQIAAIGVDVSTVGRVARAAIRSAGWPTKWRKSKHGGDTV
jgi:hypothetical protein